MKKEIGVIRECVNCRHFEMVEHGHEVENLLDTAYLISRCRKKGWKIKEHYLMAPRQTEGLSYRDIKECELWEEWAPEEPFWKKLFKFKRRR